jgi:predicted DNA-binding WGR domain protein
MISRAFDKGFFDLSVLPKTILSLGQGSHGGIQPMITPVAYLEARDPARNIRRAYSIAYGRDLFGNWIVEITYGRIGGKGRTIVTVVNNEDEALQYVQKALKRRQSAPKRIGVDYEVRATFDPDQ